MVPNISVANQKYKVTMTYIETETRNYLQDLQSRNYILVTGDSILSMYSWGKLNAIILIAGVVSIVSETLFKKGKSKFLLLSVGTDINLLLYSI